jgi:RNA polymerase sigma-70 factor (ECF subfamily)
VASSARQPARETVPPLAELYEQHFARVWRVLRRFGVPEAALDDATQDVFLVVHRRLEEFHGYSSIATWMYAIARRVADKHRTRARRAPADELVEDIPDTASLEALDRAEAARWVHRFLDGLDADHRDVFALAELEEMPAPEIAAVLEIKVNTVYSRLRAARARFHAAVARLAARQRRET